MGQDMGGRGPVRNESCFSFTKAFSFCPDHRVSLKKILKSTEEIENEAGTSDFLIKKHKITSLHGVTLEGPWSYAGEDWPIVPNANSNTFI